MSALLRRARELKSDLVESPLISSIRAYLPPLNFISVHYTYFIVTTLLCSIIFYLSSTPHYSITYTDSLFLVISAMTEAGLNTVNLSEMTTVQQVLLWVLILLGSAIWVSIWTVVTRKRVFERRFSEIVAAHRERKARRRSTSRGGGTELPVLERLDMQRKPGEPGESHEFESRHSGPRDPTAGSLETGRLVSGTELADLSGGAVVERKRREASASGLEKGSVDELREEVHSRGRTADQDHISVLHYAPSPIKEYSGRHRMLTFAGVGAHPNSTAYKPNIDGVLETKAGMNDADLNDESYPSYLTRHTTGRNAQFYGLTRAEREHLGGVEYRAITLLAYVVPIYYVLWQLLGCLGLGAYMAHNKADVIRRNGINPWWLGIFNGASAFNNSGMSLLDANMIPFQTATYPIMTMGILILAGNTAYPLFLRLILWSMLKLLCFIYPSPNQHSSLKATLRFILTYPRRVYTNLFPSAPTFWLLFMLITLNGIDWIAFELLNIGNAATNAIPQHFRVLDGLFQALAVRSGGFYIISIPSLRIGLQVLYVIMMYISVYPVVITMRHSNVYEERSLGIYADDDSASDIESSPRELGTLAGQFKRTLATLTSSLGPLSPPATKAGVRTQFIRQQVRGQLAHDLWWLVLAVLFISCIEVSNFERDPVTYSVFNIVFEVVSGYGCVGISTGLPNEAYSFAGGWKAASKLILCAVMIRGRHRGLPVALDRAVRLPGGSGAPMAAGGSGGGREELGVREEEDAWVRRSRSLRRVVKVVD